MGRRQGCLLLGTWDCSHIEALRLGGLRGNGQRNGCRNRPRRLLERPKLITPPREPELNVPQPNQTGYRLPHLPRPLPNSHQTSLSTSLPLPFTYRTLPCRPASTRLLPCNSSNLLLSSSSLSFSQASFLHLRSTSRSTRHCSRLETRSQSECTRRWTARKLRREFEESQVEQERERRRWGGRRM